MKRWVFALLLLLALPLSQPGQAQTLTQRMAGSWFGTGQPDDRSEMFIDTFNADGSFRNQHRWCRQGKASDLSETGRWRVVGNILNISIATVSGQPQPREDRYRINAVDGKTQDYTFLANSFNYKARKVDGKFPMPPCDLSS